MEAEIIKPMVTKALCIIAGQGKYSFCSDADGGDGKCESKFVAPRRGEICW